MMLGWIYADLERLCNTMNSKDDVSFVQTAEEFNSLVIDLTEKEKNFGIQPIDLALGSNNLNGLRENVHSLLTELKISME